MGFPMKNYWVTGMLLLVFGQVPAYAAEDPGRDLSFTCTGCHGTAGRSASGMPNLAGLDKAYIVKQMTDFRAGTRPATVMHQIAKGYSAEQIELLANYFSAQKN